MYAVGALTTDVVSAEAGTRFAGMTTKTEASGYAQNGGSAFARTTNCLGQALRAAQGLRAPTRPPLTRSIPARSRQLCTSA